MRLTDIKETASAGGTSAGSIAVAPATLGDTKKRGIYNEEPDSGTSAFKFFSAMRKNPHFVDFHTLNATGQGYVAKVELDDGFVYDLEIKVTQSDK